MTSVSPLNPSSIPRESCITGIPGWVQKKLQDPRGQGWQLKAVVVCNCPLNCQSGGLIRLVSTCSQVGSVPMPAKESVGGS